jgi:hypothetical protein
MCGGSIKAAHDSRPAKTQSATTDYPAPKTTLPGSGRRAEYIRALPKIIVGASTDKGILGYRLKQFRRKTRNFVSTNI